MALNIKNQEAYALAREIAESTGLSMTSAVLVALREKRAALAARRDSAGGARRGAACYGPRAPGRGGSSDTSDLYDTTLGLPR